MCGVCFDCPTLTLHYKQTSQIHEAAQSPLQILHKFSITNPFSVPATARWPLKMTMCLWSLPSKKPCHHHQPAPPMRQKMGPCWSCPLFKVSTPQKMSHCTLAASTLHLQ
ncbi:uncharacterized protein ASPGLDRAFT_345229 [Aspergillus glaucus CBS 516.65]|uniref:Uncharacterized protein n=1 Tax=Aspergillus glaucus CBS 516.65 TaxID=1160497 RepID=A0A1L9VIV3_ASPGL|nr:hypothetical protein ASPGLDRAFT_345229 [Aspergillus glaucus CBS 516.65]OJJ83812.1 hypothetical protein ASPGLDRAFT_345229 [Aspergillus glaucus CBS 516.65]